MNEQAEQQAKRQAKQAIDRVAGRAAKVKGTFIATPRCRHFVRDSGGGEGEGEPQRELLCLLHGWPQSSYCWRHLSDHLSDHLADHLADQPGGHLRLISPDLRGLGDSERSGDWRSYRKVELAKDILALWEKLGIESCMLVGHDWGGAVAQEIAILAPQKVKKLVLINITVNRNIRGFAAAKRAYAKAPFNIGWYQAFQQIPGLAEAMIPGNEETWIKLFLQSVKHISKADMQEYIRCYSIPGTALSGACYYRALASDFRYWGKTAQQKISCPTLYLYGTRDPVVVPDCLKGMECCFALPLQRIDIDAGHFVPEEAPAEVALQLRKFLQAPCPP